MTDKTKKLFEAAEDKKQPHQSEIDGCYRFTYPSRNVSGNNRVDRMSLYDSTAPEGVQNLATTTMRMLFPMNSMWAFLSLKNKQREAEQGWDAKQALSNANNEIHRVFSESNFYVAGGEALLDCVISGTGCLAIIENIDGITFQSIPISQLYFLEDFQGNVDAVFRQHEMSARQIEQRFKNIPDDVKEALDAGKFTEMFELVESSIPTPNGEYEYTVSLKKNWETIETNTTRKRIFIVFRWDKITGEVWGESQCRFALPHIQSLNTLKKLIEKHGEYQAFGLWQTQDETINADNLKNKMQAGSVLPISDPLTAVPFGGEFMISQAMIEDDRAQVRRLLMADALAPAGDSPTMTAYETSVRRESYYTKVGQPALRLEREFLIPIVEEVAARLVARGDLPLIKDAKKHFKVTVQSAVRKGLQQSEMTNDINIFRLLAETLGPEQATAIVDTVEFSKKIAVDGGMSTDLLRSPEEVAQILQQRQEQQQQMMMADMFQKMPQVQQAVLGQQTNGGPNNAPKS